MRILWYFRAWTKESTKPITLWVEAKNQGAARNLIFRENPSEIKVARRDIARMKTELRQRELNK